MNWKRLIKAPFVSLLLPPVWLSSLFLAGFCLMPFFGTEPDQWKQYEPLSVICGLLLWGFFFVLSGYLLQEPEDEETSVIRFIIIRRSWRR